MKNEAGTLVADVFLFFKKALCKVKASGQRHDFNIFGRHQLVHTVRTNITFQTFDPEIC